MGTDRTTQPSLDQAASSAVSTSAQAPAKEQSTIGVLLINTGTPASPDPQDIKPYLAEFLSDRHLIQVPRLVWWPILHGIILNTRPKKTSKRYQRIWTDDGSPFLLNAYRQRDRLQDYFDHAGLSCQVRVGMRYGTPSIDEALQAFEENAITHVIALPLFPETAFCTTKTCLDKVREEVAHHRAITTVTALAGYAHRERYQHALAQSIADVWDYQPGSKLLFSFHSVPLSDLAKGDTYVEEIETSVAAVMDLLGIPEEDWEIAYHSRFEDNRRWKGPHPRSVLTSWTQKGITRVGLVAPGFSTDCLETLYDCAIVQKDYFEQSCREQGTTADFTYIPCLNDRPDHIEALAQVIIEAIPQAQ